MNDRFRRRLMPKSQSIEVIVKHEVEERSAKPGKLRKAFEVAGIFGVLLQAALLIVIVYGVVKTVPIVQHELVKYQAEQLKREVEDQQKRIETGQESMAELKESLGRLEQRERDMRRRADAVGAELRVVEGDLRRARWTRFVRQLGGRSFSAWVTPTVLSNLDDAWDLGWTDYPLTHHSEPDLYGDLAQSLREIEDLRDDRIEIPDEFVEAASSHFESRRGFLKCPELDRQTLEAEFQRRMSAAIETSQREVNHEFMSYSIDLVSECVLKSSVVVNELRRLMPE